MAAYLAKQSDKLGLHEHAARLLDLSGDDSLLVPYLRARVREEENSLVPTTDSAAAEQLRALQSSGQALLLERGSGGEESLFRRGVMLAGVTRLPQVPTHSFFKLSLYNFGSRVLRAIF